MQRGTFGTAGRGGLAAAAPRSRCACLGVSSDGDEFVLRGADADLFGMFECRLPLGVGVEQVELVGPFEVFVQVFVVQAVVGREHRRGDDQVGASLDRKSVV